MQCQWELVFNGTLSGASWVNVNATYSLAQYDTAATAVSGGIVLDSGYAVGGATSSAQEVNGLSLASELALVYSNLLRVQDTLTFAARSLSTGGTINSSMNWLEIQ